MKRPVIIEGPDGAGKSTLLSRLSMDLDRPIFHTGGPPGGQLLFEQKVAMAESKAKTHLLDRTPHISEPIYAGVDGRPLYMPLRVLQSRLSEMSPVVVYCRLRLMSDMFRNIDQSKKPHKSNEQLQLVLQNYKNVVDRYDEMMKEYQDQILGVHVIPYSWQDDSYPKLVTRIKICAD